MSRHPLPLVGNLCKLPKPLSAGTAYTHALQLLSWIQKLKESKPEAYQWLIHKWLYHSEAEKGFMRLQPEEMQYVENLSKEASAFGNIHLQISPIGKGYSFRIRIAGDKSKTNREAGAVRWVMSWVCLDWLKFSHKM